MQAARLQIIWRRADGRVQKGSRPNRPLPFPFFVFKVPVSFPPSAVPLPKQCPCPPPPLFFAIEPHFQSNQSINPVVPGQSIKMRSGGRLREDFPSSLDQPVGEGTGNSAKLSPRALQNTTPFCFNCVDIRFLQRESLLETVFVSVLTFPSPSQPHRRHCDSKQPTTEVPCFPAPSTGSHQFCSQKAKPQVVLKRERKETSELCRLRSAALALAFGRTTTTRGWSD